MEPVSQRTDTAIECAHSIHHADRKCRIAVLLLLAIQTVLLSFSAIRLSPTHLEPAFLASGLSHWEFGRFDLYRVNPPMVRMIAALPVLCVDHRTDNSLYSSVPGSRAEFGLGQDFVAANGPRTHLLVSYARLACIPFALGGAYIAYCWATEMYGVSGGLLTLALWIFEPTLLAHSALITTDGACASFCILAAYTFWRWTRQPTGTTALLAGITLGLAQLAKMSLAILFPLWLIVIAMMLAMRRISLSRPIVGQVTLIELTAILVMNAGYAFDGTGRPLGQFQFVNRTLSGSIGIPGNVLKGTWFGHLPVPLPAEYVLGLDTQLRDHENYPKPLYMNGTFRDHGSPLYYLYAILVKSPLPLLGLYALTILRVITRPNGSAGWPFLVAIPLLVLLSVETSTVQFHRYCTPVLGCFVVAAGNCFSFSSQWLRIVTATLAIWTALSTVASLPDGIAYFGDQVGGKPAGQTCLISSSLDWGQGLSELEQWASGRPETREGLWLLSDSHTRILDSQFPHADFPIRETQWLVCSTNFWMGAPSTAEVRVGKEWKTVSMRQGALDRLRQTSNPERIGAGFWCVRLTDPEARKLVKEVFGNQPRNMP
jgi:hypothetical protein